MKKKILIRTCCSFKTGGGHLMRCISLAKLFGKKNHVFLSHQNSDQNLVKKILKSKGSNSIKIYNTKDKTYNFDLTIVDDYLITDKEIKSLKSYSKKIMIINEQITKSKFADIFYNITLQDTTKSKYRLITELKYSMVDPLYIKISEQYKVKKKVKKILVSFGLSDSKSCTLKILKLLDKNYIYFKQIRFEVFISSLFRDFKVIKDFCRVSKLNINLNIDDFHVMKKLSKIDFAIGSGGLALLERLTIGIPSLTFTISKNQIKLKEKLNDCGCTFFVKENFNISLINQIKKLIDDFDRRELMNRQCNKYFDGLGIKRIARLLEITT